MDGRLHQYNTNMQDHLQQCEVHTFQDFVTPDHDAKIPVMGKRCALDALASSLTADVYAQAASLDNQYPTYTPLVIALNMICEELEMSFVTETELHNMRFMPWFQAFAKDFIRNHHAQHLVNIDNFIEAENSLTEDYMALLTAAFAHATGCGSIGLGIVILVKGQPVQAFHYPPTRTVPDYTAWVVANLRTDQPIYYGLGRKIHQKQRAPPRQEEGLVEHNNEAHIDDTSLPSITPRKTATRVLMQQAPLPAGLTADDILQDHKSRLQYNNILKVALVFDNQKIVAECKSESLPKDQRFQHASAVVKRINTAINWIEDQYEIDPGAFRTAYDRERKANGINIRTKDEVTDAIIASNSLKIDAAMAWVRTGGPRPGSSNATHLAAFDTVAPVNSVPGASSLAPSPVPPGYAPVSSTPAGVRDPIPTSGFQTMNNSNTTSDANSGFGQSLMDWDEDLDLNPENSHFQDYFAEDPAHGHDMMF